MISSFYKKPISSKNILLGELGLTGEIRPISLIEKRIHEVSSLGFNRAFIPKSSKTLLNEKIELSEYNNINNLIKDLF